jgi:hypothetical protein
VVLARRKGAVTLESLEMAVNSSEVAYIFSYFPCKAFINLTRHHIPPGISETKAALPLESGHQADQRTS